LKAKYLLKYFDGYIPIASYFLQKIQTFFEKALLLGMFFRM